MPLPGPPNLGLLAFKLFASDLAADQAGEAQEGFVDAAVPLSHHPPGQTPRSESFLLNCRALRPRPNRLLDMKTDAAACRKSLRRLVRELGTYAYK